jgi:hypothetical protein
MNSQGNKYEFISVIFNFFGMNTLTMSSLFCGKNKTVNILKSG